ncbi:LAETG motif-containing sortase-dependent surface protein [Streptomyces sp. NPDC049967]|uniref:LAETG motif-containing sortase-dependent surface protein n=1 Tax=unclassified Streptomyces TaxID=2593676 RepID=UPI002E152360|nr:MULTISPECIES: LAETG motif-containing sortase-dependent surface protein [unclassified Streptomyces]WSJ27670.1 LPXTG cell wall anchor domain-containing protein [Streptomyces sp. NBC_01324]
MTIPRRSLRAAGTLAAAAVVGLTGVVLTAGPAAAHTPTWDVTCTEVSLHLSAYNDRVTNQVTVTVDGKELLPTESFGKGLDKTIDLPEHDKALTVHLSVKAGDGDRYSKEDEKTAPVCEGQTSTPTPTPSETKPSEPSTPSQSPTTSAPTPADTPSETASSSAPAAAAPSPSSPDLAETGSSSATPIIGGAAAAVLLAGGGIMWSVRKRRTAQH